MTLAQQTQASETCLQQQSLHVHDGLFGNTGRLLVCTHVSDSYSVVAFTKQSLVSCLLSSYPARFDFRSKPHTHTHTQKKKKKESNLIDKFNSLFFYGELSFSLPLKVVLTNQESWAGFRSPHSRCKIRAVQAGLLTPLTFARQRLSPLAAFTSGAYLLHNGRRDSEFVNFTLPTLKAFLEACSHIMCLAISNNLLLVL